MKIAFVTRRNPSVSWSPIDIESGLGGSETALVRVSEEMAKLNHLVNIYSHTTGFFNEVAYNEQELYHSETEYDLLICSRWPGFFKENHNSKIKVLWMHDVDYRYDLSPEIISNLNAIVCPTMWHINYIKRTYPMLRSCQIVDLNNFKTIDVDNRLYDSIEGTYEFNKKPKRLPRLFSIGHGIDYDRFDFDVEKQSHRFIWASFPNRGLYELLSLWEDIKNKWSDAELNIFYGWDTYDKIFKSANSIKLKWRLCNLINKLENREVFWKGKIGQKELALEYLKSDIWFYPPNFFREVYGIVALEAQAASCLCISRANGSMGEIIADRGILLPMNADSNECLEGIELALNKEENLRKKGREWAKNQTWETAAKKFLTIFEFGL